MRVFRRHSAGATDDSAQDSPGAQSPDGPAATKQPRSPAEAAKGRPTPKRSEAERNRRQPITGARPGARSGARTPRTPEDKSRARSDRNRKYEAMRRGEEWALNPRDRGPARQLARDYVDSHRRISEYYMYVLVVLLVAVFLRNKSLQDIISPLVIVLVVIIVVDAQLIRRQLNRLIAARLPGQSARGLTMYAVMRALQIRRFRVPSPRVRPGDTI
jgi:hypothetical protein